MSSQSASGMVSATCHLMPPSRNVLVRYCRRSSLEESKLSVRASAPGLAHNTSKPSCQCLLRPSRLLIRAHMSSSSAGERSSRLGAVATTPARAYGSRWKLLARAEQQLRTAPGDLSSRVGTAVTTPWTASSLVKLICSVRASSTAVAFAAPAVAPLRCARRPGCAVRMPTSSGKFRGGTSTRARAHMQSSGGLGQISSSGFVRSSKDVS
mmetsp:Transcript_2570/g.6569  ORF Transcript_2570/g.6569 Transcript_2570/m.6569 type:complete len:210 (+) Transcript_2570:502-1131(+)